MLANLSLVALVAAALSGSGLAQRPPPADTCTVGQFYCGNYLMSGSSMSSPLDSSMRLCGMMCFGC